MNGAALNDGDDVQVIAENHDGTGHAEIADQTRSQSPVEPSISDDRHDDSPHPDESSSISNATLIKNLELEARNDLVAFLRRKGLPEEAAGRYKIVISLSKPKRSEERRKSEPAHQTYFTAPDGSMLQSKGDVAMDIVQNSRLSTDFSSMRVDAHDDAKRQLESFQPPRQFGNIKVLSWGEIDTRSGFHSATQLWPVGYRCEQVVEGFTLNGVKKQEIICQVGVNDAGLPQFHIYNPSTGGTFIASTEALVWRKVRFNIRKSSHKISYIIVLIVK